MPSHLWNWFTRQSPASLANFVRAALDPAVTHEAMTPLWNMLDDIDVIPGRLAGREFKAGMTLTEDERQRMRQACLDALDPVGIEMYSAPLSGIFFLEEDREFPSYTFPINPFFVVPCLNPTYAWSKLPSDPDDFPGIEFYAQAFFWYNPAAPFAFDSDQAAILEHIRYTLENLFELNYRRGHIDINQLLRDVHPKLPARFSTYRKKSDRDDANQDPDGTLALAYARKVNAELGLSNLQDFFPYTAQFEEAQAAQHDEKRNFSSLLSLLYETPEVSVESYLRTVRWIEAYLNMEVDHPLKRLLSP